jgi:phage terminase small subunit
MAKEKYELAEKDYLKGMKYKDIAEKYGVSINTVKSWKIRYKWSKDKKSVHTKNKKVCTQNNKNKSNSKCKEDINKIRKIENSLEPEELTDKQRLFAEIYVHNFNATQAAIKAGYAYESAFVEGCRLLKNAKVKAYVAYLKGLKKESILVNIDDIVEKQMRIAFASMGDYIEFGRELVPVMNSNGPIIYRNPTTGKEEVLMQTVNSARLKESWEVDASIIKEINVTKQGTSIKLHDPQKAMDWLRDFFEENPEHKYKKEFDKKKLQLERERFEHQKKMDENKEW